MDVSRPPLPSNYAAVRPRFPISSRLPALSTVRTPSEPYVYVSGNPLNAVDPSGKFAGIGDLTEFDIAGGFLILLTLTVIVSENTGHQPPNYGGMARDLRHGWDDGVSGAEAGAAAIASTAGTTCANAWNGVWSFARGVTGNETVGDVLRNKKGSIKQAELPAGFPGWDRVRDMSMREVDRRAKANEPGFKELKKLLTDKRFNK